MTGGKRHQARMPEGANLPAEWVVYDEDGVLGIVVPSWSKKEGRRIVEMNKSTSNLFCDCPGFDFRGDCHHVRGLVWFCSRPARARGKCGRTGVQWTSVDSWHQFLDTVVGEREEEFLEVLEKEGPLQNRLVALKLGRPINSITGVCFKLRDAGIVECAGTVVDHLTGIEVFVWRSVR